MTRRTAAPLDSFQVPSAVEALTKSLRQDDDLQHLRIVARGKQILMLSCEPPDIEKHARFRYVGLDLWAVDIYSHTGRWQMTGIEGDPAELLQALQGICPWVLMPRDLPL